MRSSLASRVLLTTVRIEAVVKDFSRAVKAASPRGPAVMCTAGLILVISLAPRSATATYNANISGTPVSLLTYPSGLMLLNLSNQPTSNGSCNAGYFELDPPSYAGADVANDAAFNRMYARAMSAFTTGTQITVGYDNAGTCGVSGYIRIYRIG